MASKGQELPTGNAELTIDWAKKAFESGLKWLNLE